MSEWKDLLNKGKNRVGLNFMVILNGIDNQKIIKNKKSYQAERSSCYFPNNDSGKNIYVPLQELKLHPRTPWGTPPV